MISSNTINTQLVVGGERERGRRQAAGDAAKRKEKPFSEAANI
jgi:hypothetical protein